MLELLRMKKMKLITRRKQDYFQTEEDFRFCTGAKKVYDEDYREDGYGFIEWDAEVSEIPVEKVKLLMLLPNKSQLKKAVFPDFVGKLSALEHIVFDINFLKNDQAEKLPAVGQFNNFVAQSRFFRFAERFACRQNCVE